MRVRHGIIGGLLALSAMAILPGLPVHAQGRPQTPETGLLGIKLLDKFNTVLKKYGPPNEIQVGSPTMPVQFAGASQQTSAGGGGGMGMPGGKGGGMGRPAGMGGAGSGGGGGMMGMGRPPGMGGAGSGGGGMMTGMMRPPGMGGGMGSGGGGLPGFGGQRRGGGDDEIGGGGGKGGGGMLGGAGGGMGGGGATEGDDSEATWWYHIERKGKPTLHISFLFNKEGRVIQIQQYGYSGGGKTARGVGLGSPLGQVIRVYDWSNDSVRTGENLVMRYDLPAKAGEPIFTAPIAIDGMGAPEGERPRFAARKNKLAFQVIRNQVIGITLAYMNPEPVEPPFNP